METKVSIQMTHPMNSRDHTPMTTLRIEDRKSGVLLVDVDLSPHEFVKLLSSSMVWAEKPALVSSLLHKVGMREVITSVEVKRADVTRVCEGEFPPEVMAVVDEALAGEWETAHPHVTRYGWTVRLVKWVDDPSYDPDDKI